MKLPHYLATRSTCLPHVRPGYTAMWNPILRLPSDVGVLRAFSFITPNSGWLTMFQLDPTEQAGPWRVPIALTMIVEMRTLNVSTEYGFVPRTYIVKVSFLCLAQHGSLNNMPYHEHL